MIIEHNLSAELGRGLLLYARDGTSCNNEQLDTNYIMNTVALS